MVPKAGRKLLVVVRVIVLIRLCDVMQSSIVTVRHHFNELERMSYPSTRSGLLGNFIIMTC